MENTHDKRSARRALQEMGQDHNCPDPVNQLAYLAQMYQRMVLDRAASGPEVAVTDEGIAADKASAANAVWLAMGVALGVVLTWLICVIGGA